jgi:transcriptional regulator GlxA family with amidase domain
MEIGPPIQDGRSYTWASCSAGFNLSLAMIQEDYGVTALIGQELVSPKLEQP